MKNLNDLNEFLFNTLNEVKEDKISAEKVRSVVSISTAITNNAKLAFQVAKFAENTRLAEKMIGPEKFMGLEKTGTFEEKKQYAFSLGYESIREAHNHVGPRRFEADFIEYINKKI